LAFLFLCVIFCSINIRKMEDNYINNSNIECYHWIPSNGGTSLVDEVRTIPIEVSEISLPIVTVPQVGVPDTSVEAAESEFSCVTWETCDFNNEGAPIGFQGKLWMTYTVLKLRVICKKLKVYGIKNAKKEHIIESIMKTHHNSKAYAIVRGTMEGDDNNQQGSRKESQCPYRLINILFSDDFAGEFACIGNTASRNLLDIGKAANEKLFWERIEDAFLVSKSDYNILQFRDDEVFTTETICPGKVVPHDWKKLRSMWKTVNADYKAACTRFTQSGTHECNFYSYCNGKKEPYYLRLHLADRPELNEMIEADLPDACSFSSSTGSKEDMGMDI
jgi:hypothetical protein